MLDKDVEDIIHTTGLQLSRAQVKKLVSRSLSGDQFSYRKLTDKPLVDKHAARTDAEQQQKTDDKLATGNLSWLQSLPRQDKTPDTATAASDAAVMVNGALVNVNSVLQNLHRSEDERARMETELKNVEHECAGLRASLSSSDDAQQTLSRELNATKSQLSGVERQLTAVQLSGRQQADLLSRAAASLTALADEMNQLNAAAADSQPLGD